MNQTRKSVLTRLLYLIPLIVFTFGLQSSFRSLQADYLWGIPTSYFFIATAAIFLYQTIRNSVTGWTLVMLLYIIFLGLWTSSLIDAFDLVGAKYDLETYFLWWIYVFFYLAVGFLYVKAKPNRPTV